MDTVLQDPDAQAGRALTLPAPLLFAMFVRALPLTMFGPLLPGIARSLGAGLAEIGWIVATYATGSLIAQPVMGRLSDVRGRRAMLLVCLSTFAAGSAICAISTSLWILVAGRIVQALGAGGIQPIVTALVGDRLPEPNRGAAIGSIYAMFGLGTIAGALLGGSIVDGGMWLAGHTALWQPLRAELGSYPWHLVFWLNVVLATIAYASVSKLPLGEPPIRPGRIEFDAVGIALIAALTFFVMSAATSDAAAIEFVAGAVGCVAALIWWERRARAPLFDPSLFADRGPALIFSIAFLFGLPSFTLTIYSATYFIAQFGANEAQSGLALFVLALFYVGGAIVGGQAVRVLGGKTALTIGLLVSGAGLAALTTIPTVPAVVIGMAIGGLGLGLVSAPPNTLILSYVPAWQRGAATGVGTMLATSGSITAPAVVSAFLHFGSGMPGSNFRAEFLMSTWLCAACAVLSTALPQGKEIG